MHITIIQAVLLGILQGITEFLPVSSTAHMAIFPQLFLGMNDPGAAFSAICQLGPIIAIIAYFRGDLVRYWHGIVRSKSPMNIDRGDVEARLGWFTLLGTLPLMVFGKLLEKRIDTTFRSLYVIAVALIVLGLVLLVAELTGKRTRSLERLTFPQSQAIGWAQVLALIPGTSRSGVTITAGLFQGLDRESAARFSFLLSIPAITAAGLYKLFKALHGGGLSGVLVPAIIGAIVAGVFAYVVVRWFLGFMKEHNTFPFIIYRVALGVLLLVLLRSGRIKPNSASTTEAARPSSPRLALRANRASMHKSAAETSRELASAATNLPAKAGASIHAHSTG